MSPDNLAALSDQLVFLAMLGYFVAAVLLGTEFSYRAAWAGRAGLLVAAVGVGANLGAAVARALAVERAPWGNMYEFSVMLTLLMAGAFLAWAVRRPSLRPLGGFFLAPAVAGLLLARMVLYAEAAPLMPALQSGWIWLHVFMAVTGAALLMVASIFSILYLLKERHERRSAPPAPPLIAGAASTVDGVQAREIVAGYVAEEPEDAPPPPPARHSLWDRLPSAKTLDDLAYRTTAFGFPIWTLAVILGAIWAQSAWGRYWGWDPKETWSFIVWTIYAAYLHARATAGWRARGAAWISVIGMIAILVNYYLVNTVLVGLHSYAGL